MTECVNDVIYHCYRLRFISFLFETTDKTEKLSNYVVVRHVETLESSIPYFCCKYGFSILENESFVNFINLRRNESAYFPVIPTFGTNNNVIAIVKPWISHEGNGIYILFLIEKKTFLWPEIRTYFCINLKKKLKNTDDSYLIKIVMFK